jgi:opacity protein-like surface antigen
MKKFTLIIIAATAMNCFNTMNAKAQCIEKGKMIIDVYYGFPNLLSSYIRSAYDNTVTEGVTTTATGPFGGKFEYLLADKIGIAININYANSSIKGTGSGTDNFNINPAAIYTYKISIPRFRVFPVLNFHFATSDNLDPYFLVGAGYCSFKYKFESDEPGFDNEESITGLGNFAFRVGVGTRYFFTKNLGLNLEFGLGGGGLLQFGVATKF